MHLRLRAALACLLAGLSPACGSPDPGPGGDGGNGMMLSPCERDEDCVDDVECSTEFCNSGGFCESRLNHEACGDGVFCNGVERCSPVDGCVPADGDPCNDNNTCTIDACLEEEQACVNAPRDLDEDGDVEARCGGGDCDDRDARRSSLVGEVCGNVVDDDCDELVDEAECGSAPHDTCADPLDVSAGGTFELSLAGRVRDFTLGCGAGSGVDFVFTFTLLEAQDVSVSAAGTGAVAVALRSDCADADTEFECHRAAAARVRARALGPGTYVGIVQAAAGVDVVLNVGFSAPTDAPTNDSCAAPEVLAPVTLVGDSASVLGSLVDVAADGAVGCLAGGVRDLVYAVTTTEAANVVVSAQAATGDSLAVSVASVCGEEGASLRCVRGAPARTRLYAAAPGTYFVTVAVPSGSEPDFELAVALEPPTAPPPGDACESPLTLPLGNATAATLAGAEDDVATGCDVPYRDLVFAFDVAEPSDAFVDIDSGGSFVYAAVQSACGDLDQERLCVADVNPSFRVRDLAPGTYFLVLEAFASPAVAVNVSLTERTVPTEVSGNDSCGAAAEVPETGGLFTGTTGPGPGALGTAFCLDASGPEAVFRLDLTQARTLLASTEGSAFDTVLSLRQGSCADGAETACDDSSGAGDTSELSATVGPGTVYLVVDGFGGDAGRYVLDVVLGP